TPADPGLPGSRPTRAMAGCFGDSLVYRGAAGHQVDAPQGTVAHPRDPPFSRRQHRPRLGSRPPSCFWGARPSGQTSDVSNWTSPGLVGDSMPTYRLPPEHTIELPDCIIASDRITLPFPLSLERARELVFLATVARMRSANEVRPLLGRSGSWVCS